MAKEREPAWKSNDGLAAEIKKASHFQPNTYELENLLFNKCIPSYEAPQNQPWIQQDLQVGIPILLTEVDQGKLNQAGWKLAFASGEKEKMQMEKDKSKGFFSSFSEPKKYTCFAIKDRSALIQQATDLNPNKPFINPLQAFKITMTKERDLKARLGFNPETREFETFVCRNANLSYDAKVENPGWGFNDAQNAVAIPFLLGEAERDALQRTYNSQGAQVWCPEIERLKYEAAQPSQKKRDTISFDSRTIASMNLKFSDKPKLTYLIISKEKLQALAAQWMPKPVAAPAPSPSFAARVEGAKEETEAVQHMANTYATVLKAYNTLSPEEQQNSRNPITNAKNQLDIAKLMADHALVSAGIEKLNLGGQKKTGGQ